MNSELELILVFAFGIILGWRFREMWAMRTLKKYVAQMAESEAEEEQEPEVKRTAITLEKHNDSIFAYEEDGTFIAQGKTLHELDIAIKARFPDRKFSVKEDDLIKVGAYESI